MSFLATDWCCTFQVWMSRPRCIPVEARRALASCSAMWKSRRPPLKLARSVVHLEICLNKNFGKAGLPASTTIQPFNHSSFLYFSCTPWSFSARFSPTLLSSRTWSHLLRLRAWNVRTVNKLMQWKPLVGMGCPNHLVQVVYNCCRSWDFRDVRGYPKPGWRCWWLFNQSQFPDSDCMALHGHMCDLQPPNHGFLIFPANTFWWNIIPSNHPFNSNGRNLYTLNEGGNHPVAPSDPRFMVEFLQVAMLACLDDFFD